MKLVKIIKIAQQGQGVQDLGEASESKTSSVNYDILQKHIDTKATELLREFRIRNDKECVEVSRREGKDLRWLYNSKWENIKESVLENRYDFAAYCLEKKIFKKEEYLREWEGFVRVVIANGCQNGGQRIRNNVPASDFVVSYIVETREVKFYGAVQLEGERKKEWDTKLLEKHVNYFKYIVNPSIELQNWVFEKAKEENWGGEVFDGCSEVAPEVQMKIVKEDLGDAKWIGNKTDEVRRYIWENIRGRLQDWYNLNKVLPLLGNKPLDDYMHMDFARMVSSNYIYYVRDQGDVDREAFNVAMGQILREKDRDNSVFYLRSFKDITNKMIHLLTPEIRLEFVKRVLEDMKISALEKK